MKTYLSSFAPESLIAKAMERIDYQDIYAIKIPSTNKDLVQRMPLVFFNVFPAWFRGLMYLREAIASLIGLKTAAGMDVAQQLEDFKGEPGESIAVFQVMGRNETELLMGENDKHLDFRLSFFAIPQGEQTELKLATTVQFNGWLGKLYFIPVGPVHRLITPLILKRMAKALLEEERKANYQASTN